MTIAENEDSTVNVVQNTKSKMAVGCANYGSGFCMYNGWMFQE